MEFKSTIKQQEDPTQTVENLQKRVEVLLSDVEVLKAEVADMRLSLEKKSLKEQMIYELLYLQDIEQLKKLAVEVHHTVFPPHIDPKNPKTPPAGQGNS